MQAENNARSRDEQRKWYDDRYQQRLKLRQHDCEAGGMQSMSGRETVLVKRRGTAQNFVVVYVGSVPN